MSVSPEIDCTLPVPFSATPHFNKLLRLTNHIAPLAGRLLPLGCSMLSRAKRDSPSISSSNGKGQSWTLEVARRPCCRHCCQEQENRLVPASPDWTLNARALRISAWISATAAAVLFATAAVCLANDWVFPARALNSPTPARDPAIRAIDSPTRKAAESK